MKLFHPHIDGSPSIPRWLFYRGIYLIKQAVSCFVLFPLWYETLLRENLDCVVKPSFF